MTTPSRRERFRPLELLTMSAIVAIFVGVVVLISSREFPVALIFALLSFVVALVVLAMLALTTKPNGEERVEMEDQDRDPSH